MPKQIPPVPPLQQATFAARLEEITEAAAERGIKQKDVAKRMRVNVSTISRWKTVDYKGGPPHPDTRRELEKQFGAPKLYLDRENGDVSLLRKGITPAVDHFEVAPAPHRRKEDATRREWTPEDVAVASGAAIARILTSALGRGLSYDQVGKILVDLSHTMADRDMDPREILNVARACFEIWEKEQTGSKALLPAPSLAPFSGMSLDGDAGDGKT